MNEEKIKIDAGNLQRGTAEGIGDILRQIEDTKTAYALVGYVYTILTRRLLDGETEVPEAEEIASVVGCSRLEAALVHVVIMSNCHAVDGTRQAILNGRKSGGNKSNHGKKVNVSYDIPDGGDSI